MGRWMFLRPNKVRGIVKELIHVYLLKLRTFYYKRSGESGGIKIKVNLGTPEKEV